MRVWLRQFRTIRQKTEAQVALSAGISQPHYHCIETGSKNPSPAVAQAIADTLGFDWTLFFPTKSKRIG